MPGAQCSVTMIPFEYIHRFEHALNSGDTFHDLHQLAVSLRDEGVSQIDLYMLFSHFHVMAAADDPHYDAIVDNMDLIWGGPLAKGHALYRTVLTNEDIRRPQA